MNEQHSETHSHSHGNSHAHNHAHATGNIATAFFLNTAFAIIELVGGLFTNSVAILSDALHDLGDSFSLGTAWYFQRKSRQAGNTEFTYGYKRFSLLGAFINGIVLITGSIFIIRESIERLFRPEPADAMGMLVLAFIGIAVNSAAMLRLKKGTSINERIVSLHFLEDILGWVAVLIGSVVMLFVHIPVLDPVLSLLIAAFVLFNVYRNIKPAFRIMLQGTPYNISEKEVGELVLSETGVLEMHDYHLWTMDGEHHILSLHIVVKENMDLKQAGQLKERIKEKLKGLEIDHATIEVEYAPEHCYKRIQV